MDDDEARWSADERAAVRAFLQRSEVRLSTVHRVATALLSGAGLMVLLPAIARDSIAGVLRALFEADPSAVHALLAASTITIVALPLVALVYLLRDLTRFYFHGQHLLVDGSHVFVPRFTLTGLRLPADELRPEVAAELDRARRDPVSVELLVPDKDSTRRTIDAQLDAYGGLGRTHTPGDIGRAAGLFELVASRPRSLAEETAKVEHGMARHILRLQVIVLRYVKALLLFLTTAIAVFAASGVVGSDPAVGRSAQTWLGGISIAWCIAVVLVVADPVRTIEGLLRAEGATRAALGADRQLTHMERIAVAIAGVGWAPAAAALIAVAVSAGPDRTRITAAVVVTVASAAFGGVVHRWRRRIRA